MDSEEETSFSIENQTNKHPVEDEPKKKKAKVQRSKQKEPSSKNKPDEKDKKEWDDDETVDFIDMLEENPCLWDVFHKDYSKCDVKEIAYKHACWMAQCWMIWGNGVHFILHSSYIHPIFHPTCWMKC